MTEKRPRLRIKGITITGQFHQRRPTRVVPWDGICGPDNQRKKYLTKKVGKSAPSSAERKEKVERFFPAPIEERGGQKKP